MSEIVANPTEVAVGGLGKNLCRSRQQITRAVKAVCRISPKKLASILRFHKLVCNLRSNRNPSHWASLAVEFGFFDYAHLIREFREFAGTTPEKLVNEPTSV